METNGILEKRFAVTNKTFKRIYAKAISFESFNPHRKLQFIR